MDDQQRARELASRLDSTATAYGMLGEKELPALLREAAAALRAAPEWQPIKTAPTDGTEYLATNGAECRVENQPEGHAPGAWHLVDGRWAGSAFGSSQLSTHWIPLPVLPLAARPQGVKDA